MQDKLMVIRQIFFLPQKADGKLHIDLINSYGYVASERVRKTCQKDLSETTIVYIYSNTHNNFGLHKRNVRKVNYSTKQLVLALQDGMKNLSQHELCSISLHTNISYQQNKIVHVMKKNEML